MRRFSLLLWVTACGPAVDSGATTGESTSSSGDSTDPESGGAASTSGTSPSGTSASMTSATPTSASSSGSSSTGSSSSGEPFERDDVLGTWLCEGDEDPFAMTIDDYPAPQQLEGMVCASWNREADPALWGPCGGLTSHPLGGGANLWIFAIIERDEGEEWIVSASLLYDVPTDSLMGSWSGPWAEDGSAVACKRV